MHISQTTKHICIHTYRHTLQLSKSKVLLVLDGSAILVDLRPLLDPSLSMPGQGRRGRNSHERQDAHPSRLWRRPYRGCAGLIEGERQEAGAGVRWLVLWEIQHDATNILGIQHDKHVECRGNSSIQVFGGFKRVHCFRSLKWGHDTNWLQWNNEHVLDLAATLAWCSFEMLRFFDFGCLCIPLRDTCMSHLSQSSYISYHIIKQFRISSWWNPESP